MVRDKSSYSHIIITRFSHRGFAWSSSFDPLDTAVLSRRFDVFEATCLPSILGQTCKNFSWVLLVDEMLPAAFRLRLENLVSGHVNAFLHCYSKKLRLGTLNWLVPYFRESKDYVVTTILDDDDILCADFVARIQAHLNGLQARSGLPRFLLMACQNALQWDMVAKRRAPLGYVKPWQARSPDGRYYPPSTGFSAFSDYPDTNLSILRFSHHLARSYFADDETVARLSNHAQKRIKDVRTELTRLANLTNGEVVPAGEAILHWIPGDAPQALIVNHGANERILRLFSNSRKRVRIDGPASLARFPIDWAAVARYMEKHPLQWSHVVPRIIVLKFSKSHWGSFTMRFCRAMTHFATRLRDLVLLR